LVDGKYTLFEPIDIDVTEWHTYTISWEESNATFLVDGEVVAHTDQVPMVDAKIYITVRSLRVYGSPDSYDTDGIFFDTNQSTQIDFVRLFVDAERFRDWSEEISELLSGAEEAINEAEKRGIDTSGIREDLYDRATDSWREGYCMYDRGKACLEKTIGFLEHWDEISEMFSTCAVLVEEARQEGESDRTSKIMEGYYAQAQSEWKEYDVENTRLYLQKILDMPELALLPTLGLILLPTLLRRLI
jgi:hypothetical protein